MTYAEILWLLAAHWLSDFVLQSDAMAKNKSKSHAWLGYHVAVYTAVMTILAMPILVRSFGFYGNPARTVATFAAITAAAHFATDAVTSRITSALWARGKTHWFFVVIGADQWLHYAALVLTVEFLR